MNSRDAADMPDPAVIADWAATIARGVRNSFDRMDVTLLKAETRVADLRESLERRRQQG